MSIQAISWVFEHSEATEGSRCLMIAVANHTDQAGSNCWASVDVLAHEARMSRRGTQKALRRLEERGELRDVGPSKHGTHVYEIAGMRGGEPSSPPGGELQNARGEPGSPKPSIEPSKENPAKAGQEIEIRVQSIFAYWHQAMGKNGTTKLTPGRRRKVAARIEEGYPDEDFHRAIDNVAGSPFHRGKNDRRRPFEDLTLICRTGELLEQYRDMRPPPDARARARRRQLREDLRKRADRMVAAGHPRDQAEKALGLR